MLSTASVLLLVAQAIVALTCGAFVLASCRWVRRQSTVLGTIVALAVITRLAIGLALFWISYLALPIAKPLQLGGGFWRFALDASGYYGLAARAVDAGRLFPLDHVVAAPFFVDTLALWMLAVGVSPAAGMFLNLCLYLALVVLIVWCFGPVDDWRSDLPCIVGVSAYSFSPVVLLHSTQPLKDELSALLIVLAAIGVLPLRRLGQHDLSSRDRRALLAGVAAVALATFGMGGIRWYFGFVFLCVLALTLAIVACRGRRAPLRRYLAGSLMVLAAAWAAYWASAGPYYQDAIGANVSRIIAFDPPRNTSVQEIRRSGRAALQHIAAIPSDLLNMTQRTRTGFLMSGGATNVVVPLHEDAATGLAQANKVVEVEHASAAYAERLRAAGQAAPPQLKDSAEPKRQDSIQTVGAFDVTPERANAARAIPAGVGDQFRTVAVGLGVVFVPMTIMKMLAGIDLPGGRGLLVIADLDTVFLDIASLAVLGLLWRRRDLIAERAPVVIFGVILSLTTAVLLGYVVTNFGTLWRMRSLVAVPLWVVVLALSPRMKAADTLP